MRPNNCKTCEQNLTPFGESCADGERIRLRWSDVIKITFVCVQNMTN